MLEPTLRALKFLSARHDDDSIDRLHYFMTSNVLIALSILISYKQFGGKPIECMTPKMFPHSWDDSEGLYPFVVQKMLQNVLGYAKFLKYTYEDDFLDRLHYYFTTNLLISLSVLISWKQFGTKPIECLVPDMFSSAWEQYTENYCWAQDTYKVSFDENMPDAKDRYSSERRISYYQWVPFFLLIEAVCFRLPSLIWKYLAAHSGIKIHDIVKLAVDERNIEPQVKLNNVKSLTIHLQNALKFHRRLYRRQITPHKFLRFLNLPYSAVYVTSIYLLTKLLYLINVAVQILFLNRFLETDHYSWYGFGAIIDMMNGTTWDQSLIFPRVTLCDFKVRAMGNIQDYSVQCVLTINIFNEKIFIFLWFWYMILFCLTAFSFIYWLVVSVLPWPARWFITQHMELSELPFDSKSSCKEVERFVAGYLKTDGVFVLRMITMHSGIIFGTDLILSLWKSFYGIEETVRQQSAGLTPVSPNEDKTSRLARLRLNVKNRKGKDKDNSLNQVLITSSSVKSPSKKPPPPLPPKPSNILSDGSKNSTLAKLKRQDSDLDSYLSQHSV